jgi:hypothetical protein
LLVLSDLSGPGAQIDETGYLTGYPLAESKLYALARTWAAPEMSRPGCVWTHTLLIDFADLASLKNLDSLLSLFRRPTGGSAADYGMALEVHASARTNGIGADTEAFARQLLVSLYGSPGDKVIGPRPNSTDFERVVIAILTQQWPRLRRAFRFCTLANSDRSSEGAAFDLQLLPSLDRSVRTRFAGATEAGDTGDGEPWLEDAASDLMHPDRNGLRTFLHRIGGDVASGREAFRSLCRLHALIADFDTAPGAVNAAISLLESDLGSVQARAAHGIVASAALKRSNQLEAVSVDFLLRNLELADPDAITKGGEKLGLEIWRQKPDLFSELIVGSERQRQVAESALRSLRADDLVSGIAQSPDLASIVLSRRPDVMTVQAFWHRDFAPVDLAFSLLAKVPNLQAASVGAIIAAGRTDLGSRAVAEVGAPIVLQLVAAEFLRPANDARALADWLRLAISDLSALAQFLAEQKAVSWSMLSAIATQISTDAVPNDYGDDPWLLAVRGAARSSHGRPPIFLSAFLLGRALGWRSRNPGELAGFAFEPIHNAASSNQLSDDAWSVLQARLPWSFSWFEWDRCPRIRAAVADLFVDRDLPSNLFAHVVQDDQLFSVLADTVARGSRGRRYLKRVRRWMEDSGVERYKWRVHAIEKAVS